MPRHPRIQYPGAVYHVMNRGQRREEIFLVAEDYKTFLETLGEACERFGWLVHGYCLMPNHFHLVLETPEPNVSEGMRWFQGTYAPRFKSRNGLVGHVFQGRFKSPVLEADDPDYLKNVFDYVHLNPVRAHLLEAKHPDLATYLWCSYREFLKTPKNRPAWLQADLFFASLLRRKDTPASRRALTEYTANRTREVLEDSTGESEKEWKVIRRCWCYGSDGFKERMVDYLEEAIGHNSREAYGGEAKPLHDQKQANHLIGLLCTNCKMTEEDLQGLKKCDPLKQGAAWLLKKKTCVTNNWLSNRLNLGSRTNIFNAVRTFEHSKRKDIRQLKRRLQILNI